MAYKLIKVGDSYNVPTKTYIAESEEEVIEKMSFGDRVLIAGSGSLRQKIMGTDGALYDFSADLGGAAGGGSAELTDEEIAEIILVLKTGALPIPTSTPGEDEGGERLDYTVFVMGDEGQIIEIVGDQNPDETTDVALGMAMSQEEFDEIQSSSHPLEGAIYADGFLKMPCEYGMATSSYLFDGEIPGWLFNGNRNIMIRLHGLWFQCGYDSDDGTIFAPVAMNYKYYLDSDAEGAVQSYASDSEPEVGDIALIRFEAGEKEETEAFAQALSIDYKFIDNWGGMYVESEGTEFMMDGAPLVVFGIGASPSGGDYGVGYLNYAQVEGEWIMFIDEG